MTHYTINYEHGYHEAKHQQAIADTKRYLSAHTYWQMTTKMRAEPIPLLKVWMFYATFAGVQGYPAHAWYYEIWPSANEMPETLVEVEV